MVLFYVKVFTVVQFSESQYWPSVKGCHVEVADLKCESDTSKNFSEEICVQNITLISTQDANGIVGNQTKYMRAQNTFEHVYFPISYFKNIDSFFKILIQDSFLIWF